MVGSRPNTWMAMHWRDYIIDTLHLNTEEHGAYLLLIAHYWTTGEPLPDDDDLLADIAKLSRYKWKISSRKIRKFFSSSPEGLRHARIDAELAIALRAHVVNKKRATTAAAVRWGQNDAPSIPQASSEDAPIPSTLLQEEEVSSPPSGKKLADAMEVEFLVWYADYPQKVARAAALRAYRTARKKVEMARLVAGVVVYKKTKPPDQSWKHPATWLNGECWLDDYGPSGVTRGKPFSM